MLTFNQSIDSEAKKWNICRILNLNSFTHKDHI